mmetsp:Transcript_16975/g.19020  ORF Transcript_16975/g.19020 Transcript_16975/m.19020 type:complete len:93 (+) Transcript_16975:388-666(+)
MYDTICVEFMLAMNESSKYSDPSYGKSKSGHCLFQRFILVLDQSGGTQVRNRLYATACSAMNADGGHMTLLARMTTMMIMTITMTALTMTYN